MRQNGPSFAEKTKDGLLVRLHVQPKASKTEIAGMHGERVKVRVQAKPVEGEANEAVRRFLAKVAGVAVSDVELVRGATSREKDLLIRCQDPDTTGERIRQAAQK
jgi:uncharacterized protein